jgi:probable F420-dependent oxidoreductase
MAIEIDRSLPTGAGLDPRPAAARAEERGYAGVWAAEVKHDPFLALTLASTVTERVDLGTAITVAFARTPMALAGTANDLQNISGGRLLLGLGTQVRAHITRRFSMPWSRPAARMREYVLALRAIWSSWADGSPLEFAGEFYTS